MFFSGFHPGSDDWAIKLGILTITLFAGPKGRVNTHTPQGHNDGSVGCFSKSIRIVVYTVRSDITFFSEQTIL